MAHALQIMDHGSDFPKQNEPNPMPNLWRHTGTFAVTVVLSYALDLLFDVGSYLGSGAREALAQDPTFVFLALALFGADIFTALVWKIGIRGQRFSSAGLMRGASKGVMYLILGLGATGVANAYHEITNWAHVFDRSIFLYMYLTELVSITENITGKQFGDTKLGRGLNFVFVEVWGLDWSVTDFAEAQEQNTSGQ